MSHPVPRKKKKRTMLGAKIVRRRAKHGFSESLLSVALSEAARGVELTHRRGDKTHPKTTGYVVLFAEDGNEHYGEHVWTLKTALPKVPKEVVKFAADFYDIGMGEAGDLVNPDNIVDTAGAWDDASFVGELWQAMEGRGIKESAGFRTNDGAVVIDPYSVRMEYHYDDDW